MGYTTNANLNRLGYSFGWQNTVIPNGTLNKTSQEIIYVKSYLLLHILTKFYGWNLLNFDVISNKTRKIFHFFLYSYPRRHRYVASKNLFSFTNSRKWRYLFYSRRAKNVRRLQFSLEALTILYKRYHWFSIRQSSLYTKILKKKILFSNIKQNSINISKFIGKQARRYRLKAKLFKRKKYIKKKHIWLSKIKKLIIKQRLFRKTLFQPLIKKVPSYNMYLASLKNFITVIRNDQYFLTNPLGYTQLLTSPAKITKFVKKRKKSKRYRRSLRKTIAEFRTTKKKKKTKTRKSKLFKRKRRWKKLFLSLFYFKRKSKFFKFYVKENPTKLFKIKNVHFMFQSRPFRRRFNWSSFIFSPRLPINSVAPSSVRYSINNKASINLVAKRSNKYKLNFENPIALRFSMSHILFRQTTKSNIWINRSVNQYLIKKIELFFDKYMFDRYNLNSTCKIFLINKSFLTKKLPFRLLYIVNNVTLKNLFYKYERRDHELIYKMIYYMVITERVKFNIQYFMDLVISEFIETKSYRKILYNFVDIFMALRPSYITGIRFVIKGKLRGNRTRLRSRQIIIRDENREALPKQEFNKNIEHVTGIARTDIGVFGIKMWVQYAEKFS